jgi:hypothetical protein
MRELLKKYPLGYEGYLLEAGSADLAAANVAGFEANRDITLQGMQAVATADADQQKVGEDIGIPQVA